MKVLIIDNFDSFTYNLVQLLEQCGVDDVVVRNNQDISIEEALTFNKILLSPGPGIPKEAGKLTQIIKDCSGVSSVLGICLGHQAIAENFGAKLIQLEHPLHGVVSEIKITGDKDLFNGLPENINVGRYHSWVVSENNLPECLSVTSKTNDGIIMSFKHNDFNLRGIQFHPESVMTTFGKQIIRNWLGV